jgi:small multidrug resistance pump
MHYLFLAIAILSEVIATTSLKATEEFTRLWPSVVVVFGYCSSFYFLALTLRHIPIGIAYAIWCGVGMVLITIAGRVVYDQKLDLAAALGIGLIIAGVVVLNLFSESALH